MAISDHISKVFLVLSLLSCLTCLERPDYDLVLFVFAYLMWSMPKSSHKVRLYYLMAWTAIVDLVWLIFWGTFWDSEDYSANNPTGVNTFILIVSIIKYILKVLLLVLLFFMDQDCSNGVKNIIPNLKAVFSYQPDS
jgi:hypothetical protein